MNRRVAHNDGLSYARIAKTEFPGDLRIHVLVSEFLVNRRDYCRTFVDHLFYLATGGLDGGTIQCETRPTWELRRLAVLMLQHQFLCLPGESCDESLAFLGRLGILIDEKPATRLRESILKEGYTTTEPVEFLREFRSHLRRLDRVLAPLRRKRISPSHLRDFLATSRQECKLALARYLFRAEEVTERIFAQLRISAGEPVDLASFPTAEAKSRLANLPEFEATILQLLGRGSNAFWAAEQTSGRINSLVEQPLGTVVLTIKPPGSSLEIEIKRAGRPTARPVGVVFERRGAPVPPPHRLDGASSIDMLRWEASHGAELASIYRIIHQADAPISLTTSMTYPNTISTDDTHCEHVMDYFTNPKVFGSEYATMRKALGARSRRFSPSGALACRSSPARWARLCNSCDGSSRPSLSSSDRVRSDSIDCLGTCRPAERITISKRGSASDLAAECLVASLTRSWRKYLVFTGCRRSPTHPTKPIFEPHSTTLPNRARANQVHAVLSKQLGTFWGTLLAIRARSSGESFVGRNVGLRSVWDRGRWRVRLIFMDHDNLELPIWPGSVFTPANVFPATIKDETHVTGPPGEELLHLCAVDYLRLIYRIDPQTVVSHRKIREREVRWPIARLRDDSRKVVRSSESSPKSSLKVVWPGKQPSGLFCRAKTMAVVPRAGSTRLIAGCPRWGSTTNCDDPI